MRSLLNTFFPLLLMVLPFSANAGGGAHGGDAYMDEFRHYRGLVVEVLKQNRSTYRNLLGVSDPELDQMIKRVRTSIMARSDKLNLVDGLGEKAILNYVGKPNVEALFDFDGEIKDAVNIPGLNVVVFDVQAWDQLQGQSLRKVRLMAHEHLGLLGLELTNQNHISRTFNEERLAKLITNRDEDGMPVKLLKTRQLFQTFSGLCSAYEYETYVSHQCRQWLPADLSDFFGYQCVFEGSIRNLESANAQKIWTSVVTHVSWDYAEYAPVLDEEPVFFCEMRGSILLYGVDPIQEDKNEELLEESSFFEELAWTSTEQAIEACFERRKVSPRIRKGLFHDSRCEIVENEDGTLGYKLWGVWPFRSSMPETKRSPESKEGRVE